MVIKGSDVWGFPYAIEIMKSENELSYESDSYYFSDRKCNDEFVLGENDLSNMRAAYGGKCTYASFMKHIFASFYVTATNIWFDNFAYFRDRHAGEFTLLIGGYHYVVPEKKKPDDLKTFIVTMDYACAAYLIRNRDVANYGELNNFLFALPYLSEIISLEDEND